MNFAYVTFKGLANGSLEKQKDKNLSSFGVIAKKNVRHQKQDLWKQKKSVLFWSKYTRDPNFKRWICQKKIIFLLIFLTFDASYQSFQAKLLVADQLALLADGASQSFTTLWRFFHWLGSTFFFCFMSTSNYIIC